MSDRKCSRCIRLTPSFSLELLVRETAGDVVNYVARYELPFIFEIIPKLPPSLGRRKRRDEEHASSSTANARNVRPRVEGVEDHAITIDGRSNQLAAETQELLATGSSSEPPTVLMALQDRCSHSALSRPSPPRPLRAMP